MSRRLRLFQKRRWDPLACIALELPPLSASGWTVGRSSQGPKGRATPTAVPARRARGIFPSIEKSSAQRRDTDRGRETVVHTVASVCCDAAAQHKPSLILDGTCAARIVCWWQTVDLGAGMVGRQIIYASCGKERMYAFAVAFKAHGPASHAAMLPPSRSADSCNLANAAASRDSYTRRASRT